MWRRCGRYGHHLVDVPYQVAALFFLEGEGHVNAAADIGPHNEGFYPARMSVLVHVITQGATCLAASERYLPSPPWFRGVIGEVVPQTLPRLVDHAADRLPSAIKRANGQQVEQC